jgi:mono/diheme cytochrome c family protein
MEANLGSVSCEQFYLPAKAALGKMLKSIWIAGWCIIACTASAPGVPTFYKNVLPILQANCQTCHRPGELAPMSFLTYQSTRPWGAAIKEAVLLKKMPPWNADPAYGHFANDRTLAKRDIDTLVAWVSAGAPAGDAKDAPKPVQFVEGWNIGKPDVILSMAKDFEVPASGTLPYQYFDIPTGFTEDKWVQAFEIRPSNRTIVHHIFAFVHEPNWRRGTGDDGFGEYLPLFAPGNIPRMLAPGQARLIKAGSTITFQIHYTPNGKPARDRTCIGLVFSKTHPKERVFSVQVMNRGFRIPPGNANYPVEASLTLQGSARIVALSPHMHFRGKSFQFRLVRPGESKVLLNVPRFDFGWQLEYVLAEPLPVTAGMRIECSAHFDNSRNNPLNPDSTKEVRWGELTSDEMMAGFAEVAIPAEANPSNLTRQTRTK